MQSKAATVAEYLKELPEDRRTQIAKLRGVVKQNLPKGFAEQMNYGVIAYVVPLKLYPAGYHASPKGQPLPFASIASQKNYMSFYLMSALHLEPWLRQEFAARGKKLDMGKCCIRFKSLGDLPLDVIGEAVARMSVAEYITMYEDSRKLTAAQKTSRRPN